METKKIVECLEMCAEKLGCQRYIIGNCEENVRIGNVLDEAAKRMEELESEKENLIHYNADLNNRLNKAESHIEKLEKKNERLGELLVRKPALDGGRAQRPSPTMEWISVEDRLPEIGRYCLVVNESRDRTHFSMFCYNGRFLHGDVTHWMPLPEPPKPKEPTFKDVFLKAFPKAPLGYDGAIKLCARNVFPQINCSLSNGCVECWKQPYFESKEEGDV